MIASQFDVHNQVKQNNELPQDLKSVKGSGARTDLYAWANLDNKFAQIKELLNLRWFVHLGKFE